MNIPDPARCERKRTFFSCGGNTSHCIPWPGVCDTDPDCSDGLDESKEVCGNVGECGGNYTNSRGILTSPSYPENYPSNAECIYRITQSSGVVILLTFHSMDFETDATCNGDYLEIRDGATEDSPLMYKMCGNDIPPLIQSTQNHLWMK